MLRGVIAYWEPVGAVLEEWAARIQAEQARTVDAVARVPILAGLSRLCLARLLQGAGTIVLLALGLLVSRTVAWVLLGFPMTVLVWLSLVDVAERGDAPEETHADDDEFAAATTVWSSVPLDEGSPIIIVRPDLRSTDDREVHASRAAPGPVPVDDERRRDESARPTDIVTARCMRMRYIGLTLSWPRHADAFDGYRVRPSSAEVALAFDALRDRGYEPRPTIQRRGSDANALCAHGLSVLNLANGTERNHEPTESVPTVALEGILDVAFALVERAAG